MAKVTSSDGTATTRVVTSGVETSGKKSAKGGSGKKPGAKKAKKGVKRSELEQELATALKQVEKLRGTVKQLEAKVEKSRAKTQRWKSEARQERTRVAKLEARLRLSQRDAPVDHVPPADRGDLPVEDPTVPDASWTVARLRVLAREKNITGASRMTKAELLGAVRG